MPGKNPRCTPDALAETFWLRGIWRCIALHFRRSADLTNGSDQEHAFREPKTMIMAFDCWRRGTGSFTNPTLSFITAHGEPTAIMSRFFGNTVADRALS